MGTPYFLWCFSNYRGTCGSSRGITQSVSLGDCNKSIVSHLSSCHLFRETLTEHELILARVGFLNCQFQSLTKWWYAQDMSWRYWIQGRPCQYSTHQGGSKAIKNRDIVNLKMAREILKFHGMVVPIWSGGSVTKLSLLYFLENQIHISRIFGVFPLEIVLDNIY